MNPTTGGGRRFASMLLLALAAALASPPGAVAEGKEIELPDGAKGTGQGPFLVGSVLAGPGNRIEAYAFVHRMGGAEKVSIPRPEAASDQVCFDLPVAEMRFVKPGSYLFDAANEDGLSEGQIASGLAEAFDAWNRPLRITLFGGEAQGKADAPDFSAPDGLNELMFRSFKDEKIVSVSVLWARLTRPDEGGGIVEWDIVLNDPPFKWGDAGPTRESETAEARVMDLVDVLTHEAGHILGLGHPGGSCTEETMFPGFREGETKKRTLGAGDLAALDALYGLPEDEGDEGGDLPEGSPE